MEPRGDSNGFSWLFNAVSDFCCNGGAPIVKQARKKANDYVDRTEAAPGQLDFDQGSAKFGTKSSKMDEYRKRRELNYRNAIKFQEQMAAM